MAEPCMCGAYDCRSCGPAQGMTACPIHNEYACPKCEDFYEEHGEYPERDPDDGNDDPDDYPENW